ncbi:MAG: AraC family transcriptional regulator [Candidatus Latescibacterota bacterium]|nr:MAG: AraC family transcriptional regulator [Candidatus Latescibacterota bacterium]
MSEQETRGIKPGDDAHDFILITALEKLFDQVPDIVFFVKNREARYVSANQTLVERCGLENKKDLLGKTVLDLFPSPMGESYYEQDMEVLEKGIPLKDLLELHLYVRGEPGWCITNKIPLRRDERATIGLIGISKDLQVPADEAKGYRELADAIRYIQTHYAEPLRIEELARMSSLSVYQFEQRMKKIFQLTAGQFIAKTRIEAACDRLRGTTKSMVETAMDCGFYDQSAFARQFKSTTGLTPSEYRAQSE